MKDKKGRKEKNFKESENNANNLNNNNILNSNNIRSKDRSSSSSTSLYNFSGKNKNYLEYFHNLLKDERKNFIFRSKSKSENSTLINNNYHKKLSSQNFKRILMRKFQVTINKTLSKKYLLPKAELDKIVIDNLVFNRNCHLVSVFREHMVLDYVDEFLKRSYKNSESKERIPKFANYYKNYLKFFCNPIFRDFRINSIVQCYGDNKAELYYNKNYGSKKRSQLNLNNLESHLRTIFNSVIKDGIDKHSMSQTQSTIRNDILNNSDYSTYNINLFRPSILNDNRPSIILNSEVKFNCDEIINEGGVLRNKTTKSNNLNQLQNNLRGAIDHQIGQDTYFNNLNISTHLIAENEFAHTALHSREVSILNILSNMETFKTSKSTNNVQIYTENVNKSNKSKTTKLNSNKDVENIKTSNQKTDKTQQPLTNEFTTNNNQRSLTNINNQITSNTKNNNYINNKEVTLNNIQEIDKVQLNILSPTNDTKSKSITQRSNNRQKKNTIDEEKVSNNQNQITSNQIMYKVKILDNYLRTSQNKADASNNANPNNNNFKLPKNLKTLSPKNLSKITEFKNFKITKTSNFDSTNNIVNQLSIKLQPNHVKNIYSSEFFNTGSTLDKNEYPERSDPKLSHNYASEKDKITINSSGTNSNTPVTSTKAVSKFQISNNGGEFNSNSIEPKRIQKIPESKINKKDINYQTNSNNGMLKLQMKNANMLVGLDANSNQGNHSQNLQMKKGLISPDATSINSKFDARSSFVGSQIMNNNQQNVSPNKLSQIAQSPTNSNNVNAANDIMKLTLSLYMDKSSRNRAKSNFTQTHSTGQLFQTQNLNNLNTLNMIESDRKTTVINKVDNINNFNININNQIHINDENRSNNQLDNNLKNLNIDQLKHLRTFSGLLNSNLNINHQVTGDSSNKKIKKFINKVNLNHINNKISGNEEINKNVNTNIKHLIEKNKNLSRNRNNPLYKIASNSNDDEEIGINPNKVNNLDNNPTGNYSGGILNKKEKNSNNILDAKMFSSYTSNLDSRTKQFFVHSKLNENVINQTKKNPDFYIKNSMDDYQSFKIRTNDQTKQMPSSKSPFKNVEFTSRNSVSNNKNLNMNLNMIAQNQLITDKKIMNQMNTPSTYDIRKYISNQDNLNNIKNLNSRNKTGKLGAYQTTITLKKNY